jgi:hypothetical protein
MHITRNSMHFDVARTNPVKCAALNGHDGTTMCNCPHPPPPLVCAPQEWAHATNVVATSRGTGKGSSRHIVTIQGSKRDNLVEPGGGTAHLDSPGGNYSKHPDALCLANAVAAVLRLRIGLRVPISVKQNNRVRSSQVDPHSCSARRKQENKKRGVRVKFVHGSLAISQRHLPVDAFEFKTPPVAILCENVLDMLTVRGATNNHGRHLKKDEDAMTTAAKGHQKAIDQAHFP